MADLLTKVREEMADRMKALEPAVREHDELVRVSEALNKIGGIAVEPKSIASTKPRRTARSRKSSTGKAGRQMGSGKRRAEVLKFLGDSKAGLTIPELAKKMKLKSSHYLYRVLPPLVQEGVVTQDGKKYKAVS